MKNNFLNYFLLSVFTLGAAYGLYRNRQSEKARTLRLQNIEALATGEADNGRAICYGIGSVTCPSNGNKVEGYISY